MVNALSNAISNALSGLTRSRQTIETAAEALTGQTISSDKNRTSSSNLRVPQTLQTNLINQDGQVNGAERSDAELALSVRLSEISFSANGIVLNAIKDLSLATNASIGDTQRD